MCLKGVEGFAKYKGDVKNIIYKLIGGLEVIHGLSWVQRKYLISKINLTL